MVLAQITFSQYYFYIYAIFGQRFSHRFVGYLAESAVTSYGDLLKQIDEKKIENLKAVSLSHSKLLWTYSWYLIDIHDLQFDFHITVI